MSIFKYNCISRCECVHKVAYVTITMYVGVYIYMCVCILAPVNMYWCEKFSQLTRFNSVCSLIL